MPIIVKFHSRNNFSSLFSLHFCLPDCCVLRTPAIFSQIYSYFIFCLPDCCVLRTPAIISQVYSHYIFAYRIAACFALPQSFLKSFPTTFFAYRIATCFALPQSSPSIRISCSLRYTFMLMLGACLKVSVPSLCKHRWNMTFLHCNQSHHSTKKCLWHYFFVPQTILFFILFFSLM